MESSRPKALRNSSVEVLRIFFIVGIVMIHIYGHGSQLNVQWIYSLGGDWATAYHLSLFALGKMGVTGFMFISGLYGIRMNKMRWVSLLSICVSYYIILSLIFGHYKGLIHVIHAWDCWWFLAVYLLICLFAPLIDLGFERLKKESMLFIVAGLFIYTYVGHFLNMSNDHDVVILLTVYVFGRYISIYSPSLLWKNSEIIAALSLSILVIVPIAIEMLFESFYLQRMFLNNNNPLLLVTASALVVSAYKHPTYCKFINWLAKSVLAIYLILEWPEIRDHFNTYALPRVIDGWGLLLIPIAVIICVMIESLRRWMYEKLTQFFVSKYQ